MRDYPKRKWPRLREYDYSSEGYYYLTLCTKNRKCLLSEIRLNEYDEARVALTQIGSVVESYIRSIPGIDKYVIMPNHIHMIVYKTNGKPIATDIRSFKGLVTKKIGESIWQDYYYDHVIRNEADYLEKWRYIDENPAKWATDEYHTPA